ncbi:hypothetical protein BV25DRAFT_295291 [Artomyces pyxidatus]|uniref:Uncharacterized protein n=1 Tax=Artomyces pyxidatus TaxID=48021 RepID=A0ACB8T7T3_9AGAM|nr:hypothetical protein BV25DRAFT_295291 [Artomyces pyxidatus]
MESHVVEFSLPPRRDRGPHKRDENEPSRKMISYPLESPVTETLGARQGSSSYSVTTAPADSCGRDRPAPHETMSQTMLRRANIVPFSCRFPYHNLDVKRDDKIFVVVVVSRRAPRHATWLATSVGGRLGFRHCAKYKFCSYIIPACTYKKGELQPMTALARSYPRHGMPADWYDIQIAIEFFPQRAIDRTQIQV